MKRRGTSSCPRMAARGKNRTDPRTAGFDVGVGIRPHPRGGVPVARNRFGGAGIGMAERQGRFVKFLSTVIAAPLAVGALRRPPRETPSAANDAPAPRVDAKPAQGIFAWI